MPSPHFTPSAAPDAVAPPTDASARAPLFVIVPTHTTRHLRRTLLGIAHQSRKPDAVVVSCDHDGEDLRSLSHACAREFQLPITLVQRPFAGIARSGQVRNNAVRAILDSLSRATDPRALLVFFDGDTIPAHNCLETHEQLARKASRFVIGFRLDLSPEQTEQISESAIAQGCDPIAPTPQQLELLARRESRYRKQLWLKRLGLGKPHKPKVLSANFSVPLADYVAINGFDERFEGYGQEDDDLGRRLYQRGIRPTLGLTACRVFHQYHPTRAPGDWHDSPLVRMLHAPAPTRCELGLDHPRDQGPLRTEHFDRS